VEQVKPSRIPWESIIALFSAWAVTGIIITVFSPDSGTALAAYTLGPVSSWYHFGNTLQTAAILTITALGISISFTAGSFNLGGEGQAYSGALLTAVTAPLFAWLPPVIGLPLCLISGSAAGAVTAFISGTAAMALGLSEMITSYLIASGIVPVIDHLISGPLQNPASNLLTTQSIPLVMRIPAFLPPSLLNAGALSALVLVLVLAWIWYNTRLGYELRITGKNPVFARMSGIPVTAYTLGSLTASGAFHGFAGALVVTGMQFAAMRGGTFGIGWNGIAVALIARNRPELIIFSAIAFAYLQTGSQIAMIFADVSFELSGIVQGIIFLLITGRYVFQKLKKRNTP